MNDPSAMPPAVDAELPPGLLDQYKLAVEMADRASARRGSANSFFLTVNTALTVILGGTNLKWYVSVAGIGFAVAWWAMLRSYRDLDRAKLQVIVGMEQRLPVHVYGDELGILKPEEHGVRRLAGHREVTQIEQLVPLLFALIYTFVLVNKLSG
jgi:hypothetical protein